MACWKPLSHLFYPKELSYYSYSVARPHVPRLLITPQYDTPFFPHHSATLLNVVPYQPSAKCRTHNSIFPWTAVRMKLDAVEHPSYTRTFGVRRAGSNDKNLQLIYAPTHPLTHPDGFRCSAQLLLLFCAAMKM